MILYADDSRDDQFLLKAASKDAGIADRYVMVDDGAKAIEYLGRAGTEPGVPVPGIALLDIKMPYKDGLETLKWIRASPRWRCLPVLMLTSSLHPGDIDRCYEHGVNAYLVKPSSAMELKELASALKSFWLRFNEYPSCVRGKPAS
ncbi:MAG: response regulator [Elusimicrobia bacterium]|nr:response regulator [Elusimicrobiota bacterium]